MVVQACSVVIQGLDADPVVVRLELRPGVRRIGEHIDINRSPPLPLQGRAGRVREHFALPGDVLDSARQASARHHPRHGVEKGISPNRTRGGRDDPLIVRDVEGDGRASRRRIKRDGGVRHRDTVVREPALNVIVELLMKNVTGLVASSISCGLRTALNQMVSPPLIASPLKFDVIEVGEDFSGV